MSTKPRPHVASRLLHSRQQSALVRCLSAALLALTSVTAHALAGETDTTFATGVGRYAFAFSGATGPDAGAGRAAGRQDHHRRWLPQRQR